MYIRTSNRLGQTTPPKAELPLPPPRVLTYSTKDVIDNRISVPAQHSLVRLSKRPATSADAVGMLEAVKTTRLAGIYCVNWEKPAKRAQKFGKSWWTAIPPGADAVLMLDPDNTLGGQPLIAFRRELDTRVNKGCGVLPNEKPLPTSPARLDAALLKAWASYKLWQIGRRIGQVVKCVIMPTTGDRVVAGSQIHGLSSPKLLSNVIPALFCRISSAELDLVAYKAYDVLQKHVDLATYEVSVDGGHSWRILQGQERLLGFGAKPGAKFVARIAAKALWPVKQRLMLGPPLQWDGPTDFGAVSLTSVPKTHSFAARLSLLRDAEPDRRERNIPKLPNYSFDVLAFGGSAILSNGGSGFGRFAAHIERSVVPHGPNGTVYFAKAHASSFPTPQLVAVFVPRWLDLTEPAPIHVFFTPSTRYKRPPYPYGEDWNRMIDNYLVSKGKRFLQQHAASGRRCIFVFPVAPPKDYFTAIDTAPKLRRYLLELVYWLQRMTGLHRSSTPGLGHCAMSAFSYGGTVLVSVMNTSMSSEFPELMEVYGFDVANLDAFRTASSRWWTNGKRVVRWYNHYSTLRTLPRYAVGKQPQENAGAKEYRNLNATYLYAPLSSWQTVCKEHSLSTRPLHDCAKLRRPVNSGEVHQMMPCLFMQHALKNSGFPIS